MRSWIRDRGLLLTSLGLFAVFMVAMTLAGVREYNADQLTHGQAAVSLWRYLGSGSFFEATFENWESEFLQMGMYVLLTAYLFQRGSSESKSPDEPAPQDADPQEATEAHSPWPVRHGGFVLHLYEHSLSIAFITLFALSLIAHAIGGAHAASSEQTEHGQSAVTTWQYFATSRFWFESFQNWQSEFLAVAAIVLASIYLRERGSAESKPVAQAHRQTGT